MVSCVVAATAFGSIAVWDDTGGGAAGGGGGGGGGEEKEKDSEADIRGQLPMNSMRGEVLVTHRTSFSHQRAPALGSLR